MTREEAISILENEKKCVNRANKNDYCNRDCYNCELVKTDTEILNALDMAIKALEQEPCDDAISRQAVLNILFYKSDNNNEVRLSKELRDRIKNLQSVKPQEPKWIPCSERLPDIHNYYQEYLITNKNKLVDKAFFSNVNGKQWWSIDDVIAWKPLPKPYMPQESEEVWK